eukprot:CAMPEP_0177638614 /NCGR_PEP_ID=MMETSP0447-20121125/5583_1 /TAXON_ID=0 /ORGANISM="Stygamoeba regulata, Strain BSH-02190019" /LENGTH=325 /DNA_ID=CAMNT_0019140589 /DNA_START=132 /DNA_END=1109 /DNA_ORIENTATION=+
MNALRETKASKEPLICAFSGGCSSMALLHLIHGCNKDHLKVETDTLFPVHVVHIDLHPVLQLENGDTSAEVCQRAQEFGYPVHCYPLSRVLLEDIDKPGGDEEAALVEVVASASSVSMKEQLVDVLLRVLLARVARAKNIARIVYGHSAICSAVHMFTMTGEGRGFAIPQSFNKGHAMTPQLFYPLREFLPKEIAMYAHLNSLAPVFTPTLTTGAPKKASISKLTEAFINGLQNNPTLSHTTHTLLRISEKLDSSLSAGVECALCECQLSKREVECKTTTLQHTGAETTARVCYSCNNILAECGKSDVLVRSLYFAPKFRQGDVG